MQRSVRTELLKRLQMDPIGWLLYPHILGCAHGHRGRQTQQGRSRVLKSMTARRSPAGWRDNLHLKLIKLEHHDGSATPSQ